MESFPWTSGPQPTRCAFEQVYFARPDSELFGDAVAEARLAMGAQLAREAPVPADLVVPVPDSGLFAALGYSRESGLPFEFGLIRNHYVGRTFIEPKQSIRHFGVRIKLNPVRELIEGKRVVLVDDSIVRGTTAPKIVKMVRDAGAAEVHVRISCPPTAWPCHYGIDMPTREELVAANHIGRARSATSSTPTASPTSRWTACSTASPAPTEPTAPPAGPATTACRSRRRPPPGGALPDPGGGGGGVGGRGLPTRSTTGTSISSPIEQRVR